MQSGSWAAKAARRVHAQEEWMLLESVGSVERLGYRPVSDQPLPDYPSHAHGPENGRVHDGRT